MDIYNRAIFRFMDYDFMRLDIQDREDVLDRYLLSAIGDVGVIIPDKMVFDWDNKVFESDLDNETIELLALGVDYYWFSAKVQNSELLRNSMSTKDFTYFSPANLMRELRNVCNDLKNEYKSMVTIYSYNHGDFSQLPG
jgi:hypothetical protein